eukprot:scaffold6724_cov19-Tisochrysis_lutea.AAC.1
MDPLAHAEDQSPSAPSTLQPGPPQISPKAKQDQSLHSSHIGGARTMSSARTDQQYHYANSDEEACTHFQPWARAPPCMHGFIQQSHSLHVSYPTPCVHHTALLACINFRRQTHMCMHQCRKANTHVRSMYHAV